MKLPALALAVFALGFIVFANHVPWARARGAFSAQTEGTPPADKTEGTPKADEPEHALAKVGDKLERITCPDGYAAFVYAIDLAAPDGLALDAKGRLIVAEEGKSRITRIGKHGKKTTLAKKVRSAEGIFASKDGELFAVEDTRGGRLFSIDKDGKKTTLAKDLDAPEGVILVADSLFVTESSAQFVDNKFTMKTHLTQLTRNKKKKDGWGGPKRLFERGVPLSFSELASDGQGHIFLANETAGGFVVPGILSFDTESQELEVFATGLISPEGLCWSRDGSWPLFVAEEDIDGKEHGRLSTVSKDGERSTFATGFGTLEDVIVTPSGHIFVTEDENRQIVELRPAG